MEATDNEHENTGELIKAVNDVQNKSGRRSTINMDYEWLDEDKSQEMKHYEERCQQEIKEWDKIWRAAFQQRRQAKEKNLKGNYCSPDSVTECMLLPAHMRDYLGKAPNMDKFLIDSVQFRQQAHVYLGTTHEDQLLLQRQVVETHTFLRNRAERNKEASLLGN